MLYEESLEAISRTKKLLPQKRKNLKIRETLELRGYLAIIRDSSEKPRRFVKNFIKVNQKIWSRYSRLLHLLNKKLFNYFLQPLLLQFFRIPSP